MRPSENFLSIVLFVFALVCLGFIFGPTPKVLADTLNVPSQYDSIQPAINAARNGDTVLVSPGTYHGPITIAGKYITLKASSPDPNATVITANPGSSPIIIQNVPYQPGLPRVIVSGFRIALGYSPDGQGGGMTIANYADPLIENNYFVQNHSTVDGGAILVYNRSNPTIENNLIDSNSATLFGGGIFVVKYCSPIIYGNTITNNIASGGSISGGGPSGGGIYLENDTSNTAMYSTPVVSNNTISHNTADFAGGGIMLRVGVNAIIEDNAVTFNVASFGGGVHVETESSRPTISNNNVSYNNARAKSTYGGSGFGGGISVYNTSNPLITHNQITENNSDAGGAGIALAESSNSSITANNIAGNSISQASPSTMLFGGGVYIADAQATLTNNIINGNTAGVGGGIASLDNAVYSLVNNTIVNNNAVSTVNPAAGGGLYVGYQAGVQATITNNIIALNQDYQVFEAYKEGVFTNNLITDDNKGMYFNWNTGTITTPAAFNGNLQTNATGNIDSNPAFTNAASYDFTLQAGSPAIDSGVSTAAPSIDYRCAVRPYGSGYDIGAYEYTTETDFQTPVYRFWSAVNQAHFYTNSEAEKDLILSTYPQEAWQYESEVFDAFDQQVANTVPVYRFWSSDDQKHFYTANESEKAYIISNYADSQWHYEGIAFYGYSLSYAGPSTTVYRFWSPSNLGHFYTDSMVEKDYIINSYPSSAWTYEGSCFKVPSG